MTVGRDREAGAGRRLSPAELATAATDMGLAISPYRQEATLARARRIAAYQAAAKREAKLQPLATNGKAGPRAIRWFFGEGEAKMSETIETTADEEIAAALRDAKGKGIISSTFGGLGKVHRDGSITLLCDRPPAEVRAEIKRQLDETAADVKAKRSKSAKKAGVTGLRRRLREINVIVEGFLASGVWTPASQCRCCHRNLTDPASHERGIGPECFGRILQTVETARTTGRPPDVWAITVAEVVDELPRRPYGSGCSICGDWRRARLADREFCDECSTRVTLETAKRLRAGGGSVTAGEFEDWAEEWRAIFADSDVIAAYEAAAIADGEHKAKEALARQAQSDYALAKRLNDDADRGPLEAAWEPMWRARDAASDARRAIKPAEATAREKFRNARTVGTIAAE